MTTDSPSRMLRLLHLEDNVTDAELIRELLTQEWPECRIVRVQTHDEFAARLPEPAFDLILSDFTLPAFDGLSALAMARRLRPELPFIFFSGTIGEEHAVEALKQGAKDYIIKDRPARLLSAVHRALTETAEQQLRQASERQMREQAELLDKAQDAILVRDLEDSVLYWNRSAERIFGYAAAEVSGRSWRKLHLCPDHRQFLEAKQRLLEQGEWSGELRAANKSGQALDLMARWTLVRDERGVPRKILCIETDITEQKRLEKQFLRAQRLESIGTLAGGIAHDLNNVLAPILMSVELMQLQVKDAEIRRLLEVLTTSAHHGAELVKQVLAFARGAEGTREEFQPRLVVREAVRLLGETLPRAITIDVGMPDDLWPVMGNPTQFKQVLMNLCVNARDAMPTGGLLLLQAKNTLIDEATARVNPGAQAGPHVMIVVADSGSGIPAEIIDRIFDPFFTTKEPGRGTGLGLATVLGIVKSHGGFLQVRSEPGRGTEFRIFLPALQKVTETPPAATAASLPMGRGETILVIDDEESIRTIAASLFEACGYSVMVANDGRCGVGIFRRYAGNIKAVVTDMMMPGMQGHDVVAALRAVNPQVGIVVMSGLLEADKTGILAESPTLKLLPKPMRGDQLLRAVQSVIAAAQTRPSV